MIFDILVLAVRLASEPLAIIGFAWLGIVSKSPLHALRYAALWALTVQVFDISLGRSAFEPEAILFETALRLVGAVIVTLGIYYLARRLRRGKPT